MAKDKKILQEAPEHLIYCGPNLFKKGLKQYTVFIGVPLHIEQLLQEYPQIKALIVPVNELSRIRQKLHDTTSAEYQIFKSIQEVK